MLRGVYFDGWYPGQPIELHVHPGAPHGFDRLAPDAAVTRRAFTDRIRAISSL